MSEQEKSPDAWGQPISEERQRELQSYLGKWAAATDHGERKGPFARVQLTGTNMSWLAEQSELDEFGRASNLHLRRLPPRAGGGVAPGRDASPRRPRATVRL